MQPDTMARWHTVVETRDVATLDDLLADEVVFQSPVVHTPQAGKSLTVAYLQAAMMVLAGPDFRYVREIRGPSDAMLEFETTLDGVLVNGVDIIHWNPQGLITEFKVMVRPLKAIEKVHQQMAALLSARRGAG